MTWTSLLTLEFADLVSGYRGLDLVTHAQGVSLVDAGAIAGGRFLIFARGSYTDLTTVLHTVRQHFASVGTERLVDDDLIEGDHQKILDAAFALTQTPLAESLLIIECETVSAIVLASQMMIAQGLQPIEIKIHRSTTIGAHGFFTGTSEICAIAAESVQKSLRDDMRPCRIEVIDHPAAAFRTFFKEN